MRDPRELIERLREPDHHDPFCPFKNHCYCDDDAPHDRVTHPLALEAADALTAALEREEALLETMRLIVAMADGEDAVLDENGDDICPFELARAALENTNGK